ncbi:UbiA prenyltransferase family [Mycena galopus ATCC 62051]|nr:UbiA prenyltransferase family [Mycena galopus ATCC 62051]
MASRSIHLPLLDFCQNLVVGCIWFFFLRSAGCIWNDIVDRDLDKQVERTKHRPLADGRLSVEGASIFLALHVFVLLFSLRQCRNKQLWSLGLVTIFPLAGGYPFIKRISYWPQAWLGLAFNTSAMMAWSLVTGKVPQASITLACAGWFWTIWYDTIYGHQDKKDDAKVGIRSTALLFDSATISKLFLASHAALFEVCLAVSGILNGVQAPCSPYFVISVIGSGFLLGKQLLHLDMESPEACWAAFCDNGFLVGPTVALGIILDYLLVDIIA